MTGLLTRQEADGTLRLTLDRPAKANALDIPLLDALASAIAGAATAEAGLVVIDAGDARFFSAGGDLTDLEERREKQHAALISLVAAFDESPLPIACLQRGRAMGAGTIPALLADVSILSSGATLEFPEMDFGLYPATMLEVLSERLPRPVASRILVSAQALSAGRAFDLGLVTDVLDDGLFQQSAAVRLAYYRDRAAALRVARRLRRVDGGSVAHRVAESGKAIAENLAASLITRRRS